MVLWADREIEVSRRHVVESTRVGNLLSHRLCRRDIRQDATQIDDAPKHQDEVHSERAKKCMVAESFANECYRTFMRGLISAVFCVRPNGGRSHQVGIVIGRRTYGTRRPR